MLSVLRRIYSLVHPEPPEPQSWFFNMKRGLHDGFAHFGRCIDLDGCEEIPPGHPHHPGTPLGKGT